MSRKKIARTLAIAFALAALGPAMAAQTAFEQPTKCQICGIVVKVNSN